jgi:hypothetical protein
MVKRRVLAGAAALLAVLLVPAPLLPPHRFAEILQSWLGIGVMAAYFTAVVVIQTSFFASVGIVAALVVNRAATPSRRLVQIAVLPLFVVGSVAAVRFVKLGYLPTWMNVAVQIVACMAGVGFGIGLLYRRWKEVLAIAGIVFGVTLWGLFQGVSTDLRRETEDCLQRLVAVERGLPSDESRFPGLLQTAFAPTSANSAPAKAIQHNRAAILARGIAVGHEKLARYVGLAPDSELVRMAVSLRQGTALRGREDWARHYALSAALTVLENRWVSDAAGLFKEELDAFTHGSGFSFADFAADRAGVRFAITATRSEAGARAVQDRLQRRLSVDDFFPPVADLPENLTVEQFRRLYGGVGSPRYRKLIADIDARLDACTEILNP